MTADGRAARDRGVWWRIWRRAVWLLDWIGRFEVVRSVLDATWWAKVIGVLATGGYAGWVVDSVRWPILLPQGVLLFAVTVWIVDRFTKRKARPPRELPRPVPTSEPTFALTCPGPEQNGDWVRQRIIVTNVSSGVVRSCALVVRRIVPSLPGFQAGPLPLIGSHRRMSDLAPEWPQRFEFSERVFDETNLEFRAKLYVWSESPASVFWLDPHETYEVELVVTGENVGPERWICTVQGSDGTITRLEPSAIMG